MKLPCQPRHLILHSLANLFTFSSRPKYLSNLPHLYLDLPSAPGGPPSMTLSAVLLSLSVCRNGIQSSTHAHWIIGRSRTVSSAMFSEIIFCQYDKMRHRPTQRDLSPLVRPPQFQPQTVRSRFEAHKSALEPQLHAAREGGRIAVYFRLGRRAAATSRDCVHPILTGREVGSANLSPALSGPQSNLLASLTVSAFDLQFLLQRDQPLLLTATGYSHAQPFVSMVQDHPNPG